MITEGLAYKLKKEVLNLEYEAEHHLRTLSNMRMHNKIN
jgi:hypothetical protein